MSKMAQITKHTKSLSLWQRLLFVLNVGGPQWGRPSNDKENERPEEDASHEPNDGDESDERNNKEDRRRPDRRPSADDAPPDLDEIWKDLSGRLSGLLGNGGNQQNRPPRTPQKPNGKSPISGRGVGIGVLIVIVVAFLLWIGSGLFTVQEGQQAVVLRFGKYSRIVGPGLSFRWPSPIETHENVATDQLRTVDIGNENVNTMTGLNNASMLTQDKNILDIRFTVQYRIKDVRDFLFYNVNPSDAVTQAAESAVREVVGRSPMDVVIQRESCSAIPLTAEEIKARDAQNKPTENNSSQAAKAESTSGSSIDAVIEQITDETVIIPREAIIDNSKATCDGTRQESLSMPIHNSIQSQLDKLNTGIEIFNVNILDVQVPDKVKPAFDEARSATAERASLINEGWAYANETVASAKGVAARLEADANAYKNSVVSKAKGETERFLEIYEQYRQAPEVTRKRMYLEAMQDIYGNVSKVMMDSKNNSLLYVPIDKLMEQQKQGNSNDSLTVGQMQQTAPSSYSDIGGAQAVNNGGASVAAPMADNRAGARVRSSDRSTR